MRFLACYVYFLQMYLFGILGFRGVEKITMYDNNVWDFLHGIYFPANVFI